MRCLRLPLSSKLAASDLEPCKRALGQAPGRRDLFRHYAQLLLLQERHGELVHWSHLVLARDDTRADAAYYLAVGLRKLDRFGDAVRFYRLYAAQKPDDPDPHYAIGLCLERTGDARGARKAFERYIQLERREAFESWKRQASQHLAALGGTPLVSRSPAGGPAPFHQPGPGRRVSSAGTPAVARASAPQSAPKSASRTRPPSAAPAPPTPSCDALVRAVARDPFATASYEALASCLRAQGRTAELMRHMRTALRDNPAWSRGWLHLGQAQRASGQAGPAAASLRKACQNGVSEACAL